MYRLEHWHDLKISHQLLDENMKPNEELHNHDLRIKLEIRTERLEDGQILSEEALNGIFEIFGDNYKPVNQIMNSNPTFENIAYLIWKRTRIALCNRRALVSVKIPIGNSFISFSETV